MRRGSARVGLAAQALAVAAATVGASMLMAAPAHADVTTCTVTPPAGAHGASPATATCPAGAGAFTFRVVATCADGYPTLHLFTRYGPWVTTSPTAASASSVACNGTVPGSGFVWSATIESQ